jgi:predicted RNA-binding Zn-ribbon protein involved in translation (DUF1610 family)
MAMNCPNCGSDNLDDQINCLKCGADLKGLPKDDRIVFPCPYCGTENYDTATECKSCHNQVHSPFVYCTKCGTRNLASERVCRDCDSPLPLRIESKTPPGASPPPGSLSCPSCGREMDRGFVIAPDKGSFHGVRWSESKDALWPYVGGPFKLGDQVAENMNVPAFRCPACKLVVMRY